MKAIGVRAEQKGRTHGRYRPTLRDKPESSCQQGAVHTWDRPSIDHQPFAFYRDGLKAAVSLMALSAKPTIVLSCSVFGNDLAHVRSPSTLFNAVEVHSADRRSTCLGIPGRDRIAGSLIRLVLYKNFPN